MTDQRETFRRLADTARSINETRGTNAKIAICANYFSSISEAEDLQTAAQYLSEGAFSSVSGKRASVGSRTVSTCAAAFCEIDYDLVFKPCRYATGSASETIEKLMQNIDAARSKRKPADLSLEEVGNIYEQLYKARSRADKQAILTEAWKRMTPTEIKYFIRIVGQGSLRIGFETKSVISALAKAFSQPLEDVRYVHMITGSAAKTALLCRRDQLDEARFKLFHPLSFMLASPIESRAVDKLEEYVAEEKFDGMRSQVHADGDRAALYSRDLNDITASFPEIATFFMNLDLPDLVLDGEICVFIDNKIQPFQLLQKRMGVKKPTTKIKEQYPVIFVAYDLLYLDGEPIFGKTLMERRDMLNDICAEFNIAVTSQFEVAAHKDVERLFDQAIAHGNEGLMLKKKTSTYEYGQRRKSWLKVKKPGGSLDTVIMYAHAGSGKRGGTYSDFTLGISVKDDERYEEEFIPIGKAYGGYTDEELKRINKEMKELIVDRYGPTLALKPGLMVELEFDDIQVNKRTKANYTLRLPRFKAIRWDLSPEDADTLKDVERMFEQKLQRDRLSQSENPSFTLFQETEESDSTA